MGTPVVCIGGAFDHPSVDLVAADDEVRVARSRCAPGRPRRQADRDDPRIRRLRARHATMATEQALVDAGIEFDPGLMVRGDWTRQGGHKAMQTLMAPPQRPDAVFCANDLTAIGAMDVARELDAVDSRRRGLGGIRRHRRSSPRTPEPHHRAEPRLRHRGGRRQAPDQPDVGRVRRQRAAPSSFRAP